MKKAKQSWPFGVYVGFRNEEDLLIHHPRELRHEVYVFFDCFT